MRYRAWADECRKAATGSPLNRVEADVLGVYAFFHLPLPAGYPEVKKQGVYGRLCRAQGDTDNFLKSVADSLFAQDKQIAIMHGMKFWVEEGAEPHTDVQLICT